MIRTDRTIGLSWLVCLAAGWMMMFGGCKGRSYEGPERAPVSGTVTFDGKPLPYGRIEFQGEGDLRTATALIENGSYSIPEEQGPNLGSYKVVIAGYANNPASENASQDEEGAGEEDEQADEDESGPVQIGKQLLPPKYNTETELTVEIVSGPNTHNFELTSQ